MAKAKKADSSVQSWKKKKWIPIFSEKVFENNQMGETPIDDGNKAVGKTTKINMMSIGGDMKKQHISLTYRIHSFKEGKLYALPIGYEISNSYLKRIVRRGRDRIDYSFAVKTKDDKYVELKCTLITRNLVYNSVKTIIKKALEYETKDFASKTEFYKFFIEITNYKFHNRVKAMLSKVYPLRQIEIKSLKINEKGDLSKIKNPPFRGLKRLQEKYKTIKEEGPRPPRRRPREDRRPPHRPREVRK
jgi:small subunit ribosomal protein S3Ae